MLFRSRMYVREEALELVRQRGAILPQRELARVVNEVSDEVVGFGPIEGLLQDPDVTEVMVNGPDDVFVERKGRIERAPEGLFEGEEAVLHLIERIVGPLGIRVDESSPWADARLPDGSRVQTRFFAPLCHPHRLGYGTGVEHDDHCFDQARPDRKEHQPRHSPASSSSPSRSTGSAPAKA